MKKRNIPFFKVISPAGYASIPEYSLNISNNQTFTNYTYQLLPNSLASYSGSGPYEPDPATPYSAFKLQIDAFVGGPAPMIPGANLFLAAVKEPPYVNYSEFIVGLFDVPQPPPAPPSVSVFIYIEDDSGNTVASGTSLVNFPVGTYFRINIEVDSQNPIDGPRHVKASVNGSGFDFSAADPINPWTPFRPDIVALDYYPTFPPIVPSLVGKVYAVQFGKI
jgi:hypothetical protein